MGYRSKMLDLNGFVEGLREWSSRQPLIIANGIVGSYARGNATVDSDLDVMLLTDSITQFKNDHHWLAAFNCHLGAKIEFWGDVTTVRAQTFEGMEIEFNFAKRDWASVPVDPGTRRVVRDGMTVVYDPMGLLARLKEACQE